MLAQALGSPLVIATDVAGRRLELARQLGAVHATVIADDGALERVRELTGGQGCEVSIECSGSPAARLTALRATRTRGRAVMIGRRYRRLRRQPDPHPSATHADGLVGHQRRPDAGVGVQPARWGLHPDRVVTDRFGLDAADQAYRVADAGTTGKVALVMG